MIIVLLCGKLFSVFEVIMVIWCISVGFSFVFDVICMKVGLRVCSVMVILFEVDLVNVVRMFVVIVSDMSGLFLMFRI